MLFVPCDCLHGLHGQDAVKTNVCGSKKPLHTCFMCVGSVPAYFFLIVNEYFMFVELNIFPHWQAHNFMGVGKKIPVTPLTFLYR